MKTQKITETETTLVRKRSKKNMLGFFLACLIDFNFKSIKRFFIYLFHFIEIIDLRETPSSEISDDFIIDKINVLAPGKANKYSLYGITGLSKKTFNKRFGGYLARNGLTNKRKFTLKETYYLFKYWQGNGKWSYPKAIPKKEVAKVMFNGNYKELADEFSLFCEAYLSHHYKQYNAFSPSEIKAFGNHIDLNDDQKIEILLQYNKFEIKVRWGIAIYIILKCLTN